MCICTLKRTILIVVAVSCLLVTSPAFAGEKLKVFILAGQSNMVGHARAHTIATLYHSGNDRDMKLVDLVFGEDSGLSKDTLEEQLTLARKIDEVTGGISNAKIKAMEPGPEKTALEAEVKKLKDAHEVYKEEEGSVPPVRCRIGFTSTRLLIAT